MAIDFSDFAFIPDESYPESITRGDGDVLVPFSEFGGSRPPSSISVVDRSGREVIFEGGGEVHIVDTPAGTEEFVGYSYWESDDTDVPEVTPYVNLVVLPEGRDASFYVEARR